MVSVLSLLSGGVTMVLDCFTDGVQSYRFRRGTGRQQS